MGLSFVFFIMLIVFKKVGHCVFNSGIFSFKSFYQLFDLH